MELEDFDKKIERLTSELKQVEMDKKNHLLSLLPLVKKGDVFHRFNNLGEFIKGCEITIINITRCNISYHNGTYNESKPHLTVISELFENTTFSINVKKEKRKKKLKQLGIC